jgi:hypothetical protein
MMNRSSSTPHALHARHLLAKHWVCLVVVFDDVIQCLKTFWGSCIMHVASERLWPWSLKTEAASLPVIVSTAAWVPCAMLGLGIIFCPSPPIAGLTVHLGFLAPVWMIQSDMGQDLSR